MYTTLVPRLVVSDVDAALAFYGAVFDAKPGMRITDPAGNVVHAEMDLAGLRMSLTQASPYNPDPIQLGGSPVLLHIDCDPDAVQARATAHGAEVVFAVADRPYGARDGRLRDPFGHLWLVYRTLEALSEEELMARNGSF